MAHEGGTKNPGEIGHETEPKEKRSGEKIKIRSNLITQSVCWSNV